MGMNGDDDGARVRSVSANSKTAARSFDFDSASVCSNMRARKARASSRESADTTRGLSLAFASHSLNVLAWAATDGAKISGVILGSLPATQRSQQWSRVSYP